MNELYYETSLAHHGIKGQKWGIRRFQNKDGSLTSKGIGRYINKRKNRKWYDKNKDEIARKQMDYEDEYDRTSEGKKKKNLYDKETQRMIDDPEAWEDDFKSQKNLSKIEESYIRSKMEYGAKKLISEYGEEKISIYANKGETIKDGENVVKAISDKWWDYPV